MDAGRTGWQLDATGAACCTGRARESHLIVKHRTRPVPSRPVPSRPGGQQCDPRDRACPGHQGDRKWKTESSGQDYGS